MQENKIWRIKELSETEKRERVLDWVRKGIGRDREKYKIGREKRFQRQRKWKEYRDGREKGLLETEKRERKQDWQGKEIDRVIEKGKCTRLTKIVREGEKGESTRL